MTLVYRRGGWPKHVLCHCCGVYGGGSAGSEVMLRPLRGRHNHRHGDEYQEASITAMFLPKPSKIRCCISNIASIRCQPSGRRMS